MKKFVGSFIAGALLLGTAFTAQAQEKFELTFSTYLPPAYEYVAKPMDRFVELVEERSEGRIKINVFHSGQLFGGYEELQALSRGDIDITNMTGSYPSGSVKALTLFILPFVFEDVSHMQRALQAGLLDLGMRQALLEQHDTVVLGVAPWDPYEFYTRKNPIESVSDFAGTTWATTGETDARAIQLLGGAPTSMSSSELYLAFDRGVIDGTPRPLLTGIGRSLHEVVKHIALSNFVMDTSILAINRKTWDKLPADLQQVLMEAAAERDRLQFAMVEDFIEEAIGRYRELGVEVRRLDAETIAKLRRTTQPAITGWLAEVENGQRYLDLVAETK